MGAFVRTFYHKALMRQAPLMGQGNNRNQKAERESLDLFVSLTTT
jgi:hypothetical protein